MIERFLRHLVNYLPSKLLPALTGLITVPIFTRLFSPEEYGFYALAVGLPGLLYAMTCSGLGSASVRFYPEFTRQNRLGAFLGTLGASAIPLVTVVALLAAVALRNLKANLNPSLYPLLFIGILIFILQSMFTISLEIVRAQERSRLYSIFELSSRYGALAMGLLLVVGFGLGVEGLLWGTVIALGFALPLIFYSVASGTEDHLGSIRQRKSDTLAIARYAWPLTLGNVAMWFLVQSDRYFIGFFRSEAEAGMYSAAYSISGKTINLIVALFLLTMGPLVINTWEREGAEPTGKVLAMVGRYFLLLGLPAATGLAILGRPFVMLLTPLPYHEAHRVVGFVAFSSLAWGFSQIAGTGLLLAKNTLRISFNQILAATANIGLNLLLVPRFGFVAAGATTLVGYLILLVLQSRSARRHLRFHLPLRTALNAALSAAIMAGILHFVLEIATTRGGSPLVLLLIGIGLGPLVYFAALWLLGEASAEERRSISDLMLRLGLRKSG